MFLKAIYPVGIKEVRLCLMHKIAFNSSNVEQITPNLILVFGFRLPILVLNSQIEAPKRKL